MNEERRWQQMYRKAKAVKETLIVEELRKKVVPVEQVEAQYVDRMVELKTALLGMGSALGPQLVGQELQVIVEQIDEYVFDRLAQYAEGMFAVPEDTQERTIDWLKQ